MIDRPRDRLGRHRLHPDPADAPEIDVAAFQGPVPEHLRPAVVAAQGRARSAAAYKELMALRWAGRRWVRR